MLPAQQANNFFYENVVQIYMKICLETLKTCVLLALLSRRLMGELIGYSWSGVRPSSVIGRLFAILKDLLLHNHLANQSQILCGTSLGRGNENLLAASGRMTKIAAMPIYVPFKNLLHNRQADFHQTLYVASGTPSHHSLFK